MTLLGIPCPSPPLFEFDTEDLRQRFRWVDAMSSCPQHAEHHGEGDVLTHTLMVLEALVSSSEYRRLNSVERDILFTACLLHDVGKPAATKMELDQLTARAHAGRGEVMARRILWELNAPIAAREHVCHLIGAHEVPFFLIETEDPSPRVLGLSHVVSNKLLSLLAEADARGRLSDTKEEMLENVELFAELCREESCFDQPYPFANDLSRFEYFRKPNRDPRYKAYGETQPEVLILSGLPGAGKDHWIEEHASHLPMVSLDAIRKELDVGPTRKQGLVVHAARERAQAFLRDGERFIWNATNLSRKIRRSTIELIARYGAPVVIQSIEVPPERLYHQNRSRDPVVPEVAIDSLLSRWQVPDLTEAVMVMWNDKPAGWQ